MAAGKQRVCDTCCHYSRSDVVLIILLICHLFAYRVGVYKTYKHIKWCHYLLSLYIRYTRGTSAIDSLWFEHQTDAMTVTELTAAGIHQFSSCAGSTRLAHCEHASDYDRCWCAEIPADGSVLDPCPAVHTNICLSHEETPARGHLAPKADELNRAWCLGA